MTAKGSCSTDVDQYFKAVVEGDLQKVKELIRERRVLSDTTNQVLLLKLIIVCDILLGCV